MKIGIDARFFGTPGKGLGRYTEKLVRGLEKIDTKNSYEIFLYGESFDQYEPTNPNFTKVRVKYRWYGFAEQLLYPFFLYQRKLDVVHFPHFNVPLLYRKPFVVTIHDLILLHYPTQKASTHKTFWYTCKYFLYLRVIQSAITKAMAVCAVSQFTRADVENVYPDSREKMYLTLEGVDQSCFWMSKKDARDVLETYWQKTGRDKARKYALYVGNSYPHKNLQAFLLLAKAEPDVDIVLVGRKDFFYERFEEEISQQGIQNIYMIGTVSDEHLAVLYRFAQVYVFPSLYEGFGLPPLEAMQYSLPVLVSNRGSLPEIVGDAASICDPDDETSFIKQYKTLLYDDVTRADLQAKGKVRASVFCWTKMAEATKDVYNKAVSR